MEHACLLCKFDTGVVEKNLPSTCLIFYPTDVLYIRPNVKGKILPNDNHVPFLTQH